jgi:methionyl-tRNA formyltransferase
MERKFPEAVTLLEKAVQKQPANPDPYFHLGQAYQGAGKHKEAVQDESQATYEGWCRRQEARINWANHVDFVYNVIRGCNPAPGAWCTLEGKELQIYDARKHPVRTFGAVKGKIGEIVEVTDHSFQVTAQGGRIEVMRAKLADGKKVAATELLAAGALRAGQILS